MKRTIFISLIVFLFISVNAQQKEESIRAFNIDYNWDPKGGYINSFAKPGLWADADPAVLMKWYEDLGCNVVHSFAVSCNGYSWYKNSLIPEQPGLKYDFLTEMVKIGNKKKMKVFGYYCVGANTKWGLDHPEQSYGTPAIPHIPFTTQYIDYLCASIKDAMLKTGMHGVMLDWVWTPSGYRKDQEPIKWLPCEQIMYKELMGKDFPGVGKTTAEEEQTFRCRSIDRIWSKIYQTVKQTDPNCLIWVTCNNVLSPDVAYSKMFREADWLMNEAGDIEATEAMYKMVTKKTKLINCLADWNGQDPADVATAAIKNNVALYGFTKPIIGYEMPAVSMYLKYPVSSYSYKGDSKNIAVLARVFKGLPIAFVKK